MTNVVVVNGISPNGRRFVIDGDTYLGLKGVLNELKKRGVVISYNTLWNRMQRGQMTWAELSAPPRNTGNGGGNVLKHKREREREECAAAIEAVDRRKREMGL